MPWKTWDPGCGCGCATPNTTICAPCTMPATTGSIQSVLTYRNKDGGTGSVSKTLTWFAPSSLWCAVNANPNLGCVFTLNDYDGTFLSDSNNAPCFFSTNNWATNHILQVSCSGGASMLVKHLVSCASGAAGRTFTFFVSSYTTIASTCSTSAGGTTVSFSRADTSSNPDKSMVLTW